MNAAQTMKRIILILTTLACISLSLHAESNRDERRAINAGNKLYKENKLAAAAAEYTRALQANPSSAEARFNLGLAQVQLAAKDTTDRKRSDEIMQQGTKNLSDIAAMGKTKPLLASRANYNLGNLAFNSEQYGQALQLYKQALRLNPDDNNARRNLRITQKKLEQQQNQDQNKDQNKDQDKDKQDQNKDQNKDQQDQNKDKQDQNKDQQPPQQDRMNQQTADQILKSIENKEDQVRARVNAHNQGKEKGGSGGPVKKW